MDARACSSLGKIVCDSCRELRIFEEGLVGRTCGGRLRVLDGLDENGIKSVKHIMNVSGNEATVVNGIFTTRGAVGRHASSLTR